MLESRVVPTCYWWNSRSNFGDLLTPLLLDRFADTRIEWAPIKGAKMVGVGSILDIVPFGWSGTVIGSGKLREGSPVDLSHSKVLALRGPLTAKNVTGLRGEYVLGDLGLLADELVTVEKRYDLGIVPHWSDTKLEHRPEFKRFNPKIIRPSEAPLEVIRMIGQCKKIVASSLHGIILADAFGIPRRIEMTERFAQEGGDFKFRDHCEAVSVPFKVGVTQEASRSKVQDRQHELYDVLQYVRSSLTGFRL